MRKIVFGAIGAALLATAPAQAQTFNITLAGASPGGLWSAIGAGVDRVMNAAYPGSTVTYQTGSGGLANARLVQDRSVPIGIAADMELHAAYNGTGPFRGNPQRDLRVLFRVYSASDRFQYMYVLLNGDVARQQGITTMADLKDKARAIRFAVNRPGNMDGDLAIAILEASGIPLNSFRQVVRAASSELTSLMLDRRIDGTAFGVSFNHARIQELQRGIPLVQLSAGVDAAAQVATDFGGEPCRIEAHEIDWIQADMLSVCVGGVIMAHKDMPEAQAYALTKAMVDQLAVFQGAHRAFARASLQSLSAPGPAPHHPGAERAFREAGARP